MVIIRNSNVHGEGVFSKTQLMKGTELTCSVILFNKTVKDDNLLKYSYPWDNLYYSLCVGFGSFFNHSITPNIKINSIDKIQLTKTFVILSTVEKGQELFLNYGKSIEFN